MSLVLRISDITSKSGGGLCFYYDGVEHCIEPDCSAYLKNQAGGHNKYYEMHLVKELPDDMKEDYNICGVIVKYGRIGSAPREHFYLFSSVFQAEDKYDKLLSQKVYTKGYDQINVSEYENL